VIYGKQIVQCLPEPLLRPGIGVLIARQDGERMSVASPITYVPLEDNADVMPTFNLQRDAAQQLMDELWRCGLRPSEGSGSAGALAATERHLADMRTVAFHHAGIKP
jgi:hypothetical protein